ncbi:enoyl-CoA hydratase/isomerase family protein [Trinickia sp. LjRoot230]|uniref:enoyl-CoA hydratase/isomerase family protein n=1 Tax=Trinickia sp. LjRoot230 TaxID=3342288 RepID=UPI003ECF6E1B
MNLRATTDSLSERATGTPLNVANEPHADGCIVVRVVNSVAIVTLDRPHALNALSHRMVRELAAVVERCREDDAVVALVLRGSGDKGFCAGGDVRALYRAAQAGLADGPHGWRQFFIDEYRLDFALHAFPKPIVALADGIAMGGGMGLAQAATLRVSTERSKIAMPETRIGFLPDVGATRFLSVMPGALELYVGLTGAVLSGADAVRCGLADVCVPHTWLAGFEQRLAQLPPECVEAQLREVFVPQTNVNAQASLDRYLPEIAQHFDTRLSIEDIAQSLESALRPNTAHDVHGTQAWLRATLDALRAHSPTMLHVTHAALLRGRTMTLGDAFRAELDIVSHAIDEGDFREGVRAHLIDKDGRPQWRPATLADVSPERVRHFLASPWTKQTHPLADLGALAPRHASGECEGEGVLK